MPTLYATLAASILAWLFDDLLGSALPLVLRLLADLIVSTLAFYFVRRFFANLREEMR
jgi:hypothetical protein